MSYYEVLQDVVSGHYMTLLMWFVFGQMMSRCYDDGVHVDEGLYPALNDQSNPVLKNKKVIRFKC